MALKRSIRRRLDPLLERFAPRWGSIAALRRRAANPRADAVAVPPESLIRRSGWTPGTDVVASYLRSGVDMKELLSALVADAPSPVRVLDFGCGVAKTLRHFAAEGKRFELFGCDIDGASIDWLAEHHSSYASFALLEETPGLPYPDGRFDLAYAVSVFTHLADNWAGWLLELRRVLAPEACS